MKILPLLISTCSIVIATSTASAADPIPPPPTEVVVVDHTATDRAFALGQPMIVNSSYRVQAGRRVKPGEVEVHEHDTDIFYVLEGTATL